MIEVENAHTFFKSYTQDQTLGDLPEPSRDQFAAIIAAILTKGYSLPDLYSYLSGGDAFNSFSHWTTYPQIDSAKEIVSTLLERAVSIRTIVQGLSKIEAFVYQQANFISEIEKLREQVKRLEAEKATLLDKQIKTLNGR